VYFIKFKWRAGSGLRAKGVSQQVSKLKIMKRLIVLAIVGCTLGAWSLRTDHMVVAQQRTPIVATRIFTGPDGQTHAQAIELKLAPAGESTEVSEMAKATGVQFRRQAPNYFEDWHTAPRRQYVITLSGHGEIEVGGGKKIPLGPGHVLLVEDLTGKGHISRGVGTEDRVSLLIPLADFTAQERPVPVENEPHHRTVFKNKYVQVFRVRLKPGDTSLMHTHFKDDASVRLSTATVAADSPGKPIGAPEPVYPGLLSARDNEAKPLTHRVHNIGTTLFDVILVQILKRPAGPASPAMSLTGAENSKMRAYRYDIGPGITTAQHVHARPFVFVAVTDVDLETISPNGSTSKRIVKAGDIQWIASRVTHSLANRGTGKAIIVEFEVK
jgi:quercetin dioxygenase-like cupin family protein